MESQMVKLSELGRVSGFELVRDAEIDSFGFMNTELENRLVYVTSERYAERANTRPGISAVLTSSQFASFAWRDNLGLVISSDPGRAFVELHNHLAKKTDFYGSNHLNSIDPSSRISPMAHIDEIGVVIGPDCRVGPGAVINRGSTLGCRVRVMPGTVIGW